MNNADNHITVINNAGHGIEVTINADRSITIVSDAGCVIASRSNSDASVKVRKHPQPTGGIEVWATGQRSTHNDNFPAQLSSVRRAVGSR